MKVFCIIGALMFCMFTYWQINDLAQYGNQWWQGWLLTYLFTALLSLTSAYKKLPRWLYFVSASIALLHAGFRAWAIQPEKAILYNPENPAGNETGGLIVVCLWCLILAFWKRKTH